VHGVRVDAKVHALVAPASNPPPTLSATAGLRPRRTGRYHAQSLTLTAEHHIVAPLGRKRRELTAADVDRWLRAESLVLSSPSLRLAYNLLNRAIRHVMARDKITCTYDGGPDRSRMADEQAAGSY
jgi:hypothetical protein